MLDIKLIRDNVEEVIRRLNTRGGDFSYLRDLKAKDERKRDSGYRRSGTCIYIW